MDIYLKGIGYDLCTDSLKDFTLTSLVQMSLCHIPQLKPVGFKYNICPVPGKMSYRNVN